MVLLPKDEGVCWIDNFIVTAESEVEATSAFLRFLDRCKSVNVELNIYDDDYGVPLKDLCVVRTKVDQEGAGEGRVAHHPEHTHMHSTFVLHCFRVTL